ncbi:MAG: hypothetical protein Q8O57_06350, partial [Kiritimatiellota bacterium]|nr:hypothetical protein [Kiritimatiellota bacterium]
MAHGREFLGLPDDALPELRAGHSLVIADAPVNNIRYLKTYTPAIMDGDHNTLYPGLGCKLYAEKGPFRIALDPPETFQLLTLQGGFKGTVYISHALDEKPDSTNQLLAVDSRKFTFRRRFNEPITAPIIQILPDRFPGEIEGSNDNANDLVLGLWQPRSKLTEMRIQSFQEMDLPVLTNAEALKQTFFFVKPRPAVGAVPDEISDFIAAHFAPEDASAIIAANTHGNADEIPLQAMQSVQLMIPAQGVDVFLDTLALDLALKSDGDSAMRIAIRDPEMPRILWYEAVCRFMPAKAGTWERVCLTADPVDTVIPAGKMLWLTLTTEKPITLRVGGQEGSRI